MANYKAMFENPDGTWFTATVNESDKISEHFTFKEIMNQSCTPEIKLKWYQESVMANKAMEYVRIRYGKAITISCCYREEAYNKRVGGTSNSLHLKGCAYDCQFGKISKGSAFYNNLLRWVECACEKYNLQAELGLYPWGAHVGFCFKLPYKCDKLVYEFIGN